MTLRMEPGQTYDSWADLKEALDTHCNENKVIFNIANAKTVESANSAMKKGPFYDPRLKYAHCILQCKHFGSYTSSSAGLRPKQRSYKINCRAFISISACRKENYLIIRDSYHKHSHPCSEEIYNSYPEVRRMTKDERRMVGHLLDLGVPISQIKSAVGKNVTPKDLHNAKSHIKAVKLGLKEDDPKNSVKHRRTQQEIEKERQDVKRAVGEHVTDSEDEGNVGETSAKITKDCQSDADTTSQVSTPFLNDSQETAHDDSHKDVVEKASHESRTFFNPENPSSVIVGALNDDRESDAGDMGGLSGLLAAAGSVDALGTGAEEGSSESKTSYTVVVDTDGNLEMAKTSTKLHDLLKNAQAEAILKKKQTKSPLEVKDESTFTVHYKHCENCGKYLSPLDGHSLCIACLGPQHLHVQEECEHCAQMKPEQLSIRRKVFVRMRMKALKDMNENKRQNSDLGTSTQNLNIDEELFHARRGKRIRKPKDFGPEMAVNTLLGQRLASPKFPFSSKSKVTKCVVSDGEKEYVVEIPKREPDDDYAYSIGVTNEGEMSKTQSMNTPRFDHLLRQTAVLEDITLVDCPNGGLGLSPDSEISDALSSIESQPNVPSIPLSVQGKYALDTHFESTYCFVPAPLDPIRDSTFMTMGSGLHKLAQNAVAQTKLAVYDRLFTQLGIGMADEALSILSQLCGKVTQVTEISQEDLTNDLQTAQDTIHALKDVLEEIGVMSKDSLSTAAHQRNISISSLEKAKNSIQTSLASPEDQTPSKRRKFQPFSRSKVVRPPTVNLQPASMNSIRNDDSSVKVDTLMPQVTNSMVMNVSSVPSTLNTPGLTSVLTVGAPQTELHGVSEVPTTYIDVANKQYTIAPAMSLSSEILETLHNQKEGIIELHVVKNAEDLVANQDAPVVHEVLQQPIEGGHGETSNVG